MPRLPTYQPLDVLKHVDDVSFAEQANRDISNLIFGHQAQQDIETLTHLPALSIGRPGTAPTQPPSIEQPQAPESDLPIAGGSPPQPMTLPTLPQEDTPSTSQDLTTSPSSSPDSQSPTGTSLQQTPGSSYAVPSQADIQSAAPPTSTQSQPIQSQSQAPSPANDDPWGQRAYAAAVKAGHPNPTEFVEQMRWESGGFDPDVIAGKRDSPRGAQGIAQIMPPTARGWGVNPLDPDAALSAAAQHMTDYYQRYGGDSEKALAAYNMGEGNLQKYGPRGLAETNKYINIIGERTQARSGQNAATTQPLSSNIPGPEQSPNGTPITAPTSQRSGGLDVGGIVTAYKDTSYTYGGPGGRTAGFGAPTDCSGFVAAVYQNQYGLSLVPHTDGAYNQLRQAGAAEVAAKDARPGDVVFYMGAGTGGAITHHMGIYAGDGKVLDDSVSGQDGVHVRDVGHAGQYVILRDPRLNQQAPPSASVPPPIQPANVAEATGGEKVSNRELQAQAQTDQPTLYRQPLGMPTPGDTRQASDMPPREPLPPWPPVSTPGQPYDTGDVMHPAPSYPIDTRPPGAQPGDVTDDEGVDRSLDPLLPPWQDHPPFVTNPYAVPPGTMYRQPLGPPTAGPDTTGVGSQAGLPVRDDYATAGSSVPAAIPSAQAIPQEDPTAIPRPAYIPPAMPLVTAPESPPAAVSGPRFNPLAGNDQPPQPGELPPRNAPPPPAPLIEQPTPTPASSTAPYNPLANQPPAQPGELPARPGVVEPPPVSEVGAVGAYTRGNAPPPAVPDVVQAVNRGETVNPFHWANQVSDAAADQVVQSVGIDPESAQGIASKFVVSAVVNPINWEGGAFSATAEAAARAGLPFLRAALPAIAERFGAETAGRVSTWLASQGSELAANVAGQAAAGAVTNPEAPGFGAAFGGGTAAVLGPAGRVIGRGVGAVGSELRAGAERAATVEAERAGQGATAYGTLGSIPPERGLSNALPAEGPTSQRILIEPQGWEAHSDEVPALNRPDHYYRGMTEEEFDATVGQGRGIGSRGDFSVPGEGTSFAANAETAESYANFGRDDPRKTGRPTYLVEIAGNDGLTQTRDGYFKAPNEVPPERITRIIRMTPENGAIVGDYIEPPRTPSTTTSGTLGTVPPSAGPDRLAGVNRALGQGVASAVSGGVGAATNQQLNPEDPNAAIKGFAVGAVAPFAISRGARALASRAGREAGPVEGALGVFGVGGRPKAQAVTNAADPTIRRVGQMMEGDYQIKTPPDPRTTAQRLGDAFAVAWTDNRAGLYRLQNSVSEALGRKLQPDEMVAELSRLNPASTASQRLSENLRPALQQVGEDQDWLSQYLVHSHNVDVAREMGQRAYETAITAGKAPAEASRLAVIAADTRQFSGDLNLAQTQKALADIESTVKDFPDGAQRWQAIQDGAQAVWQHNRETLQRKLDAGLISQDLFNDLTQKYPRYVRTDIADYFERGSGAAKPAGRTIGTSDVGIQKLDPKGTGKDRVNPLLSTIDQTYTAESAIQRNQAGKAFEQLVDADPTWANTFREVVPQRGPNVGNPQTTVPGAYRLRGNEQFLTVWDKGDSRTFVIPGEFASLVSPQGGRVLGDSALANSWRSMMGIYKGLITSRNPAFSLVVSPIRDAGDYAIREAVASARHQGPLGAVEAVGALPGVIKDYVAAVPAAFSGILQGQFRGDLAAMMRAGAGQMSRPGHTDKELRRALGELSSAGGIQVRDLGDLRRLVGNVVTLGAGPVGERLEQVPRLATARRAATRGASTTEQAMAFRDATVDFQRGGDLAKSINAAVPFFNTSIQGGAQVARTARQNPAAFLSSVAATIGLATAGAEAWNNSDPQRAQDYQDVPDYLKKTGIIFMLPGVTGTDQRGDRRPNFAWIPTGNYGALVGAARNAIQKSGQEQGGADLSTLSGWGSLAADVAGTFSPLRGDSAGSALTSLIPPPLSTAADLVGNKDLYRGTTIATDRADQNASALAAGSASAFNRVTGQETRPSQWDYLYRDLGGFAAGAAGEASNMLAEEAGLRPRQQEQRPIQDFPVAGGMVGRVIRDSVGRGLQTAQDERNRVPESIRPILQEAGLRREQVAPVPSTLQNIPLTRAEQADWQDRTNGYIEREVDQASRSAAYRARGADQQKIIQDAIAAARSRAANEVFRQIPPAERSQRLRDAQAQKAS